jgi:Cu2+-containing amine oxidase
LIIQKSKLMETTTSKKELIDWISNLKDEEMLLELAIIKRKATFNFDEEFKRGISLEEAKKRSIEKIRKYWSK